MRKSRVRASPLCRHRGHSFRSQLACVCLHHLKWLHIVARVALHGRPYGPRGVARFGRDFGDVVSRDLTFSLSFSADLCSLALWYRPLLLLTSPVYSPEVSQWGNNGRRRRQSSIVRCRLLSCRGKVGPPAAWRENSGWCGNLKIGTI